MYLAIWSDTRLSRRLAIMMQDLAFLTYTVCDDTLMNYQYDYGHTQIPDKYAGTGYGTHMAHNFGAHAHTHTHTDHMMLLPQAV